LSCLRAAPTDRLALGGSSTLANRTSALFPLGPILDGKFITQRPVEAFRDGHFVKVPVFFG
jgi:carboxylesterase type B